MIINLGKGSDFGIKGLKKVGEADGVLRLHHHGLERLFNVVVLAGRH